MQSITNLNALEAAIGYTFKDKDYLTVACTHSSYANEGRRDLQSNERQEFLGDSVLSVIVSDYLFRSYRLAEGELTRLRSMIVCEKSLCAFAKKIGLGSYLLFGKGETQTGGAQRPSILADAFESLIAAIYLDGGIECARGFVLPFVEDMLKNGDQPDNRDFKTLLQEIVQQNPGEVLTYALAGETGPDHDKLFIADVLLNSNVIGRGEGRSKKSAEQMAAKEALRLMGHEAR
ncbi:MAG: ribonuclease III [Oscillospiraceae bacterium]|nr:ribonuclease III [Oscillospiraceae bacterium]